MIVFHPGIAWVFHVFQHLVQYVFQHLVLNRIVTFRKWICTIATASSQNNITYDMITANEFLLLQKFRNRMLTMHIAQILVRFGGFRKQPVR